MGNRISMCLYSSRESSNARITDSSIWSPHPGQHISIQTYRELNPAPMSSPISIRTEIHWNGENSRSTGDLLGEAARRLTTPMPRR
ncbi:AC4 protein [Corchorus yellow vein Cuba virus]|uniref:AC4 protein n=2 Tax=Begomovirus TaxID=10814 RepID=A0A6N3IIM0_9GEMI|nr:AC4 protein [Corchorus yellow vein Cuba virus]AXU39874.1 AC4 protein [Corchorus yellow vein virus]AXU39869.1 AC4 protein [Corchorus yellow vein Cuba virus]AXU39879.1 AC4 protein [Corchorus yellow vein virus]AXU39884.1 AC4 protein [Corchorus yellow vein virus]AXU39889.1 AC4 protein [Corchorus yellow vein virus]